MCRLLTLNFHAEMEYLKEYSINKKFCIHIFENEVAKFLNILFSKIPIIPNISNKYIYIKVPYYGSAFYRSRSELNKLLNKAFFHICFLIILTITLEISLSLKLKTKFLPMFNRTLYMIINVRVVTLDT